MRIHTFVAAGVLGLAAFAHAQPLYTIVDIGVVGNDSFSQGFAISPATDIATGRSIGSTARAFTWTQGGGQVGLSNLASPARAYSVGNGVNNAGVVVGTGSTTLSGAGALPLIWQGGSVAQLPLPAGQTIGRAQDINNSDTAVGSVNGGSLQRAAIFTTESASVITRTFGGGIFMNTAFGINDAGLVVGTGLDPNNAARTVGFVYDSITDTAFEVGIFGSNNGALCYGVGDAGHVVGSSTFNGGSGLPFIWSQATGTLPIPLPVGTSQGSARAVNASGWAVGTASSAFAIPFLFDGVATYRVADLIPAGTGWDLSTNTSSSALGISDRGVIVGTGLFNGQVHAYAMIPVPAPGSAALAAIAAAGLLTRRRKHAN